MDEPTAGLDPAIAKAVLQDLVSNEQTKEAFTEREMEVLHSLAHGRTCVGYLAHP